MSFGFHCRAHLQNLALTLSVAFLATFASAAAPAAQRAPEPFSFATVQRMAQQLASKPYRRPNEQLPEGLAKLGYDEYRDIRYRPDNALWHGQSLFEVQFFHRGSSFARKVNISEVTPTGVQPVVYSPSLFDFGPLAKPGPLPPDTGFAGFRVHFPLQSPRYKDELMVFLGASYFRVLGRNENYGLSARGLAINTASPNGEEFPWFSDFWLVRPGPEDRTLTIYAILDSQSITGAYRFDVRPGTVTQVEVTADLFPRTTIEKLGIAPLTSMFLYGETRGGRTFDDYRPEVHDSDGLIAETGRGEWLWRPLANPRDLRVSRLMDEHPRGFGLAQRDRDPSHYEDNESHFERRPSYWIEPLGDWAQGGVELVEIPSDEEIHDNIVSYWVPTAPVKAKKPLHFSYLLSSFSYSTRLPPGARVVATRNGNANLGAHGARSPDGTRRIIIDFAGGDLDGLSDAQPLKAELSASSGDISDLTVERIPALGTWRVAFRLHPNGTKPSDLHCYLSLYGESLTETWTYLWTP